MTPEPSRTQSLPVPLALASSALKRVRGLFQGGLDPDAVKKTIAGYSRQFDSATPAARQDNSVEITRDYYQLVTDFFEYGWGQSFHFAPLRKGASVKESIAEHERALAARLELSPGKKVLDIGCGVGGPARTIARATSASITGITISPYQVERARKHTAAAGLSQLCQFQLGDFNQMPFEANTFDAAWDCEACCHAADRRGPFREAFRVLKPGGLLGGYDWCMTDSYREGDERHERVKLGVEKGNGVAKLLHTRELDAALKDSGFQILETKDLRKTGDASVPWYTPLASGVSLQGFRNSRGGAFVTHQIVRALERLKLAPDGTVTTHEVLRLAQASLVEAGELDIFTPMYFFLARKPA